VEDLLKKTGAKDTLVRLSSERGSFPSALAPQGSKGITQAHALGATVIASNRSYESIASALKSYIYDESTGLAAKQLAALSGYVKRQETVAAAAATATAAPAATPDPSGYETDAAKNAQEQAGKARRSAADSYAAELMQDLRTQVSNRVGDILDGRNGFKALAAGQYQVKEFGQPVQVTLSFAAQPAGRISPFLTYDGKEWFKATQNVSGDRSKVTFYAAAPGTFSAVLAATDTGGLAEGSPERAALEKVTGAYDLSDVFSGIGDAWRPDLPATGKELVLLYERVLGLEGETFGMTYQQKLSALGLSAALGAGGPNAQVERQRAAALFARMYARARGVGEGQITAQGAPGRFTDQASVGAAFRDAAGFCVEAGLLDAPGGAFSPARALTRGEAVAALARLAAG